MEKPILFNTEMVQAILAGRKTQTRRIVKPQGLFYKENGFVVIDKISNTSLLRYSRFQISDGTEERSILIEKPFKIGDVLWVRETWAYPSESEINNGATKAVFLYKADGSLQPAAHSTWKPSIHMPREAARLFLKVKDVRSECLQQITEEEALAEGVPDDVDYPINPVYCQKCNGEGTHDAVHPESLGHMEVDCEECNTPTKRFSHLWDSTIKPSERDIYGWEADPWVWVIEFERMEGYHAAK